MAYKPPVDHRTPRSVAVEHSPAGTFMDGGANYDAAAGVPLNFVRGLAHDNVGPTFGPAPTVSHEKSPLANLKGGKE